MMPGGGRALPLYVIGTRPETREVVVGTVDDLLRGVSDGAAALAEGDDARFLNMVALRTQPARNSGTAPQRRPADGPAASPSSSEPAGLTDRLRQLADRFRPS